MALLLADHKIKMLVFLLKKNLTKSKPKLKPQTQNTQKKMSLSVKEQIKQKSSLLLTSIHNKSSLSSSATEKYVDFQLKISFIAEFIA